MDQYNLHIMIAYPTISISYGQTYNKSALLHVTLHGTFSYEQTYNKSALVTCNVTWYTGQSQTKDSCVDNVHRFIVAVVNSRRRTPVSGARLVAIMEGGIIVLISKVVTGDEVCDNVRIRVILNVP